MPRDSAVPPPQLPERPKERSGAGVAAAIAAACLICAPLTARFEGKRNAPYRDAVGVPTVCYGETRVAMRVYSDDECGRMLRASLAKTYGPQIARCLPQLTAADRRHEFVALLDTSYNSGPPAVCPSPMAVKIRAGDWAGACSSIKSFYVGSVTKAPVKGAMDSRLIVRGPNRGKYFNRFRGLVTRRAFFADFCMKPEPPPALVHPAGLQLCLPLVAVGPPPPIRRQRKPPLPNQSELT